MAVHDVVLPAVLREHGAHLPHEPLEVMPREVHLVDDVPELLELLVEALLMVRDAVVLRVVQYVVVHARLVAEYRHVVGEAGDARPSAEGGDDLQHLYLLAHRRPRHLSMQTVPAPPVA